MDQTSEWHEILTGVFWRLVIVKNHTEFLLATPSMCQSRDLLIHVLFFKLIKLLQYIRCRNYKPNFCEAPLFFISDLYLWKKHLYTHKKKVIKMCYFSTISFITFCKNEIKFSVIEYFKISIKISISGTSQKK